MKIPLETYKKPDGTIDYKGYLRWMFDEEKMSEHRWFDNGSDIAHAQVELGWVCQSCYGAIGERSVTEAPRECEACKHINDEGMIIHPLKIRCPYCKASSYADPLIEKYPHDYTCKKCSTTFAINQRLAFFSPPLSITADF
jgi:hypothetical protein